MADLLDDGVVLDDRDEELEFGPSSFIFGDSSGSASAGDTKLPGPHHGKYVCGLPPWDLNAVEFLKDLEDRAAGSGGVVVIFVKVLGEGELKKAVTLRRIIDGVA